MTFTATIAGQTFTDAALFEAAAKSSGYKLPRAKGIRITDFRKVRLTDVERDLLGTEVTDGETVGTVWSLAPGQRKVWVIAAGEFVLMAFTEEADGSKTFRKIDHYIPRSY